MCSRSKEKIIQQRYGMRKRKEKEDRMAGVLGSEGTDDNAFSGQGKQVDLRQGERTLNEP